MSCMVPSNAEIGRELPETNSLPVDNEETFVRQITISHMWLCYQEVTYLLYSNVKR